LSFLKLLKFLFVMVLFVVGVVGMVKGYRPNEEKKLGFGETPFGTTPFGVPIVKVIITKFGWILIVLGGLILFLDETFIQLVKEFKLWLF